MGDEEDYALLNGQLARVMIDVHVHKNDAEMHDLGEAFGLLDGDTFRLLWTRERKVWDECGGYSTITLTQSEIRSAQTDYPFPTEADVALAKFRLTGVIEPIVD